MHPLGTDLKPGPRIWEQGAWGTQEGLKLVKEGFSRGWWTFSVRGSLGSPGQVLSHPESQMTVAPGKKARKNLGYLQLEQTEAFCGEGGGWGEQSLIYTVSSPSFFLPRWRGWGRHK